MSRCRRPKAPSAAFLPHELSGEILSWLTVKPLMRFRCVSKSWNTLISDPTFVQMHLKRSARNPHLVLMWKDQHLNCSVVPFPIRRLLENPSTTLHADPCNRLKDKDCCRCCCWVVGSCNGLLCLLGYYVSGNEVDYWLCFFNPATRKRSENFGLFCDFLEPLTFKFTFGYDNSTGTYKVVAFCLEGGEGDEGDKAWRSVVKIFSLEDNSWRNIRCFPVVPLNWYDFTQRNGVHLSGTLNWLAIRNYFRSDGYFSWKLNRKSTISNVEQYVILSLDLSSETYTQLLLPRGFDEVPCVEPTVGVLMDCLCFSYDFRGTEFVLWQMKDFGVQESWIQLLKITYQNLQINDKFDDLEFQLLPLFLSENGDTLILANDEGDQAIIYNWRDNRVERTRITNKIWWYWAMDSVESLVSTP